MLKWMEEQEKYYLVCPNSNIQQFKGHHQNFQLVLRRSNNDLYDYKDDHYIDDGKGRIMILKLMIIIIMVMEAEVFTIVKGSKSQYTL